MKNGVAEGVASDSHDTTVQTTGIIFVLKRWSKLCIDWHSWKSWGCPRSSCWYQKSYQWQTNWRYHIDTFSCWSYGWVFWLRTLLSRSYYYAISFFNQFAKTQRNLQLLITNKFHRNYHVFRMLWEKLAIFQIMFYIT